MWGKKIAPGQEYSFAMVISPNSDPNDKVDELNGEFVPERGDTLDSIREQIFSQYCQDNRYAKKPFVVSFSYR